MTSGSLLDSLFSYAPLLSNGGVAVAWIAASVQGWIVSKGTHETALRERDDWKALFMKEQESHQHTREALAVASQRGDSMTDAGHLMAAALNAITAQAAHEVPAAPAGNSAGEGP